MRNASMKMCKKTGGATSRPVPQVGTIGRIRRSAHTHKQLLLKASRHTTQSDRDRFQGDVRETEHMGPTRDATASARGTRASSRLPHFFLSFRDSTAALATSSASLRSRAARRAFEIVRWRGSLPRASSQLLMWNSLKACTVSARICGGRRWAAAASGEALTGSGGL